MLEHGPVQNFLAARSHAAASQTGNLITQPRIMHTTSPGHICGHIFNTAVHHAAPANIIKDRCLMTVLLVELVPHSNSGCEAPYASTCTSCKALPAIRMTAICVDILINTVTLADHHSKMKLQMLPAAQVGADWRAVRHRHTNQAGIALGTIDSCQMVSARHHHAEGGTCVAVWAATPADTAVEISLRSLSTPISAELH